MQINNHFAIGLILASITHYYFEFTLLEFSMICIFSFLCDFDVIFTKYARDLNHRNLFTHSIIPSIFIIIVGALITWPALTISGVSYFLHIMVDTFDWGTNLFYFGHYNIGLRLLITKEEQENLEIYLDQYKNRASFFDFKRYKNKLWILLSIIIFILMMIVVSIYALEYFYLLIFYFIGLAFHLQRHFHLKKIENS
ncbi:MAG: conserved membrane protein of unknown function [Promethearchaeota archaeon]|nr:MAG: conserved membrane protein of unknown function [Candidatus Lokiarchaeota archaeon]